MPKIKNTSYLLSLTEEDNRRLNLIKKKLGWTKKTTLIKLIRFFSAVIFELQTGREIVVSVRDRKTEKIVASESWSYDAIEII